MSVVVNYLFLGALTCAGFRCPYEIEWFPKFYSLKPEQLKLQITVFTFILVCKLGKN